MRYEVRTFDATRAQVCIRTLEATDLAAARALAAADGGSLLSLRPLVRGAAPALDLAWWCRELRTLLDAGMTVVEALETLQAQPLGSARVQLHATLLDLLHQGLALSEALRRAGGFPAMLVAGVKAGERTSALVPALDDYLRYHDMLAALRRRAVTAAIYPAMVLVLGLLIAVFLMLVVVPRFAGLYAGVAGAVSLPTAGLLAASRLLAEFRLAVVGGFAALLAALAWAWRSGALARLLARGAETIGPVRRRLDEFRLAKLYQSLALLFKGGYALDEALRQCESLGLGARLHAGTRRAGVALATGRRVSDAFDAGGLTDAVTRRLLAVGERTGNFERVLQTIAERHAARFETLVERATRVVEPAMLLAVALLVGGLVLLLYMPIFDMAGQLG